LAFKTCRVGQLSVMCSKRQRLDDVALWHGIVFGVVSVAWLSPTDEQQCSESGDQLAACMHWWVRHSHVSRWSVTGRTTCL